MNVLPEELSPFAALTLSAYLGQIKLQMLRHMISQLMHFTLTRMKKIILIPIFR